MALHVPSSFKSWSECFGGKLTVTVSPDGGPSSGPLVRFVLAVTRRRTWIHRLRPTRSEAPSTESGDGESGDGAKTFSIAKNNSKRPFRHSRPLAPSVVQDRFTGRTQSNGPPRSHRPVRRSNTTPAILSREQARPRAPPSPKLPHIERRAYRIVEFCAAHGVSRAKYYELRKLGLGPHETNVDGVIIITEEDAATVAQAAQRWSRKSSVARKSA